MPMIREQIAIELDPGTTRRVAWADRERGYLDLSSHHACCGEGYIRGDCRRLRDVLAVRHGKLMDRSTMPTFVMPGEIHHGALSLALLMEEGAFWASLRPEKMESGDGLAFVLPASRKAWQMTGGSTADQPSHTGVWIAVREADPAYGCNEAIAIASTTPFNMDTHRHHGGIRMPAGDSTACATPGPSPSSECTPVSLAGSFECYLAWGPDSAQAVEKAARLASSNAIQKHRADIDEFLSGATLQSGHGDYDKALAWAAFSGWSLVTREYGLGIWAGLPWFRDNWGRDTFIALPGILLASGRFSEAREIIATFAGRQNLDEGSPDYGRVPNRWRSPDDVIYNTADGTPWFIREVWDYAQHSGDAEFVTAMSPYVFRALDADLGRCDESGFLKHGHADTWMDARIDGKEPWSPRGDRAVEVQALFYTALLCGARIATLTGQPERAVRYRNAADLLRVNFIKRFWFAEHGRLADRLLPDAADGAPGKADLHSRPNALMAITVPSILDDSEALLPPEIEEAVLADCLHELVYPYGVASLSQEDPFFHARHDRQALYHKDAAYHNGTIWGWNAGFAVSAMLRHGQMESAWILSSNIASQVLHSGVPGTLSENLDALPAGDGAVVPSGTYSQAWSVSEFTRNAFEDWLGFRPRLMDGTIVFAPRIPVAWTEGSATPRLGNGDRLEIKFHRDGSLLRYELTLLGNPSNPVSGNYSLKLICELPGAHGNVRQKMELKYNVTLYLSHGELADVLAGAVTGSGTLRCAEARLAPWNGASRHHDFLRSMILSGSYDAGPVYSLASWYDSAEFAALYHSDEKLGALYSQEQTEFRLWSPVATAVQLQLWPQGDGGNTSTILDMKPGLKGVWKAIVKGDLHGMYYTYRVRAFGLSRQTIDPYARSAGLNGVRGMVLDPARAAPAGWNEFMAPACGSPCDAIVYEAHIRDLTSHPSWKAPDENLRCTYGGFVHPGSRNGSIVTGFDHIRSMGVTHVQLLPVFDFVSVDESRVRDPEYQARMEHGVFNWGYDPGNYSAPEGSYSSNPRDGECRVRELRSLVKEYGDAGIGIIMDVVYNHVPDMQNSALDACVPGYYFRGRRDSGAGDDTASERFMFARYMADTLVWWLEAYRLSGFRFDLMGLHDVATINMIAERLRAIKPDVILYGEGWDMYRGPQSGMMPACQRNVGALPGYGMFNDAFRDGVKGSVFEAASPGWIHDGSLPESVKHGVTGAVRHRQMHYRKVTGTAYPHPWTDSWPSSVNYVEVHDNLTLRDKLELVEPGRDDDWYARLQRLALTLVLVSQGMPVMHAGMEFLRSKRFPDSWLKDGLPDKSVSLPDGSKVFCHDSYKFGDTLNGLDWEEAERQSDTVRYIRGIIALRKALPLLRLRTGKEIRRQLRFVSDIHGILAWTLGPARTGRLLVAANANPEPVTFTLPRGTWRALADSASATACSPGTASDRARPDSGARVSAGLIELPAKAALILERIG